MSAPASLAAFAASSTACCAAGNFSTTMLAPAPLLKALAYTGTLSANSHGTSGPALGVHWYTMSKQSASEWPGPWGAPVHYEQTVTERVARPWECTGTL